MWWYWLGAGVVAWLYDKHTQKQSALQSIDACLLLVQSASTPQANQVQNPGTIHNPNYGDLKAESTVSDNYKAMVTALGPNVTAPEWLSLATAVQSAGYPLLSNSISTLGMHLLENGQIGL